MSNSMLYRLCGKRDELLELIEYLMKKKMKYNIEIERLRREIEGEGEE